jgi:large subunit ribosomal protein L29
MSLKEFEKMDKGQLAEREAQLRKHLFDLRSQAATEKVKDVSQYQKTRRDIARILTLKTQQENAKK